MEPVASRGGGLEESLAIHELEADALDLGLDAVGALVLVLEVAVQGVHPLAEVVGGGDIVQREHRRRVLEALEAFRDRTGHTLGGAAGVA